MTKKKKMVILFYNKCPKAKGVFLMGYNNIKKTIAAIAALAMLCSVGCGGSKSSSSNDNNKSTAGSSGSSAASSSSDSDSPSTTAEAETEATTEANPLAEDFAWKYDEATKTLTFSGHGAMPDYENANERPWNDTDPDIIIFEPGLTTLGQRCGWRFDTKNITIPDTIQVICSEAFGNNRFLEQVVIPDSVEIIADSVFFTCPSLESVTLPKNLKEIGGASFGSYTNISSITIPDSVVRIGAEAFAAGALLPLENVVLPSSVEYIGDGAFKNTRWYNQLIGNMPDGLVYINTSACDFKGDIPENYELVVKEGTTAFTVRALAKTSLKSVSFPDELKYIGSYVFSHCESLNSVNLPDSLVSIEERAFEYCEGLTSITIPGSVKKIDEATFVHCTSLTDLIIEEGVTTIGPSAFAECEKLSSITLPVSLKHIESGAFDDIAETKDIYYAGTEEQWKAIVIDSGNSDLMANSTIHYNS